MKKDRLVGFKKRLLDKQYQLVQEVGRTALYGKDQEDDSIKDLGDQANTAYTREFFFELGNGDRRLLREVVMALQKIEDGSVRASLHRLPAAGGGRGAHDGGLIPPHLLGVATPPAHPLPSCHH